MESIFCFEALESPKLFLSLVLQKYSSGQKQFYPTSVQQFARHYCWSSDVSDFYYRIINNTAMNICVHKTLFPAFFPFL